MSSDIPTVVMLLAQARAAHEAIGATLLCGILSWWLFTQPDATEPNQFFWINLPMAVAAAKSAG